jgi:hypothetical protein
VGPRAVLDAVVKRKIPSPRRESKPRTPIVQPVAQTTLFIYLSHSFLIPFIPFYHFLFFSVSFSWEEVAAY